MFPFANPRLTGEGNVQQDMPNLTVYGGTNYGNKTVVSSLSSYWVKLERIGNITGSAFDRNPATQWFYSGASGWLQCDLDQGNAQAVERYTGQ